MRRTTGVTVGLILSAILGLSDAVGMLTDGGEGHRSRCSSSPPARRAHPVRRRPGLAGGRAGIATVIVTRLLPRSSRCRPSSPTA